MDIDLIANIIFATIRTGTPLLIVALGELVCEKSGVLNLGQEGMMLMGAVIGFMAAFHSDSVAVGFFCAMLAGISMSLIFGFITMNLNAENQGHAYTSKHCTEKSHRHAVGMKSRHKANHRPH